MSDEERAHRLDEAIAPHIEGIAARMAGASRAAVEATVPPRGRTLVERLLTEYVDDHERWVEENGCVRGDEADVALAVSLLAERSAPRDDTTPRTHVGLSPEQRFERIEGDLAFLARMMWESGGAAAVLAKWSFAEREEIGARLRAIQERGKR